MEKLVTPIVDMLEKYVKEQNIRFHTPGHKGKGFKGVPSFLSEISMYDITEVPGTDDLRNPKGVILQAEELLAKAYGAAKSFFIVNGSTCGNLAAIAAAFNREDTVIVDDRCHWSVANALDLVGATVIYIEDISVEKIYEALKRPGYNGVKGVIITRPDYYGQCVDIEAISNACRVLDLLLITDEAHGAHLSFAKDGYPKSAVKYSDFTIQSAHKTLGALNQSSFLHLNNRGVQYVELVREKLNIFQTSSPSYPILASADYTRAYMVEHGAELLNQLRVNTEWAAAEIEKTTAFKVRKGDERTPDRLVVDTLFCGGVSGNKAEEFLRSKGIQVELSDESCVVCLCTVFDERKDFERLVEVLCEMEKSIV